MFKFFSDCQNYVDFDVQPVRVSPLFEYGFFEIRVRMENKVIRANCMTCQRMGRQNLIQAREDQTSNLVAHLKVSLLQKDTAIDVHLTMSECALDQYLFQILSMFRKSFCFYLIGPLKKKTS